MVGVSTHRKIAKNPIEAWFFLASIATKRQRSLSCVQTALADRWHCYRGFTFISWLISLTISKGSSQKNSVKDKYFLV